MTLDPTARKANFRDSIKKYLVDSLNRSSGIELTFDKMLTAPTLQGTSVDRWVSVVFGPVERKSMSTAYLELYCCTRKDPEGFRLSQLVDTVVGYLTDPDMTDTMKRITLYRSYPSQPWESIGSIVFQEILESDEMVYEDMTKFVILTVTCRWGSRI